MSSRAEAIREALINHYASDDETSLSILDEHDWNVISHQWARGIDWYVHKQGKRHWRISLDASQFAAFPLFKTKKAADEAASNLLLAESKHRAKLRLEAELAALVRNPAL